MHTYTVVGATGNIGKKITENLLAKGQKVRAVARDISKLNALKNLGADTVSADVLESKSLVDIFKTTTAAFIMIPPNYAAPDFDDYMTKASQSLVEAIRDSKIQYVVSLSSIGAHEKENLGPINGLNRHEARLNVLSGVNIVHLRPAYFMENLLWNVDLIKNMGINGSPLKGDALMPMIATQDIAKAATELLLQLDFKGQSVRELLGKENLALENVTQKIGQAIGKPNLPYVQFPYDQAKQAMLQMGMSESAASLMIEMQKGFNDGVGMPTERRSGKNTTETSIDDFIKDVFLKAYR